MTDETPSVEEIKQRLKVEIPVEEEVTKEMAQQEVDIAAEFKEFGRQFTETLRTAWNSEERYRLESEIREGVKSFADEVDRFVRETKDSKTASRVREEATQVKTKVDSTDLGRKTRTGIIQGLQWLSEELGKLADQFTPAEEAEAGKENNDTQ